MNATQPIIGVTYGYARVSTEEQNEDRQIIAELRAGVTCHIYGKDAAKRDVQLAFSRFQQQYPNDTLQLLQWSDAHDRFIVCDDTVWLCGASVKDAGRKMFALVKMSTSPDFVVNTLLANS